MGQTTPTVLEMLEASAAAIVASQALTDEKATAAHVIADALDAGHKLLTCGNGGSAADAQHFAGGAHRPVFVVAI